MGNLALSNAKGYGLSNIKDTMDMHGSATLPSRIASLVHAHFDALPRRSKPIAQPDGWREWIPMAGIVVVRGKLTSFNYLYVVFLDRKRHACPRYKLQCSIPAHIQYLFYFVVRLYRSAQP